MCGFSIILILKGFTTFQSPCILLNKNKSFNKNETESKMENPTHSFTETNLYFSAYKNRKLNVKLWWVGARERKKRAFFLPCILAEGNLFNICLLSQCIVYWIHFQNMHTFTYQKTLRHTLIYLFLKSSEAFSISLISGRINHRRCSIKKCF